MAESAELIREYCSAIDNRAIILLGIVALLWILEPKVKQLIDKIEYDNIHLEEMFGHNNLKIMYKWIGVGILFMVGLVIYIK